ncbi:MAG TPA: PDZ domain-containing protein, partial [Tahibacter sp.]|nr:PDZ domain-containing protein [Tahibacter sp.]
ALFGARGELFTAPAKNGEIRNISRTPAAREIGASWSPDGKSVAYLSDASGEYEIYVRAQDGSGEPRRLTHDGDTWRFAPVWSPDSRKLAYADKHQRLRILDIATGKHTEVDRAIYDDIVDDNDASPYVWSPDSAWLAYTKTNEAAIRQVWLYSLDSGRASAATDPTTPAFSPSFDPQGRWLFFLSNRDWNLTFSAYEQNYLYTNAARPYAATLAADGPALYPLKSDEVKPVVADVPKAKDDKKKADKPAPAKVRVDVDGLDRRVAALKAPAGNYASLRAADGAVFYLTGNPREQQGLELKRLALDEDKEKTVAANIADYRISKSGGHLLLRQGERYAIVKAEAAQDFNAGALNLDRMEAMVDPRVEWQQEFTDAWRILRDWFYDPGVHGGIARWNAVRERYAAWVPYVATRADLDYVLHEVAGEANAGHVYVQQSPDAPKVERRPGGLLGATFATDASGYFRVAKVYAGQNWSPAQRSPLTETGATVREGEFLLAVDGVDARSVKNPYALLQGKGDQVVTLRVNGKPSDAGARDVRVRALTSEANLRYADWVASRRALVDKLSNGRIGYLHVPNTSEDGNRELNRGLLAYHHKEALIVDERYNGGGFIPDRMIELLTRKPLNYWKRRDLEPAATPLLSHDGPKAMLINGPSGSGGDAFPYYFKKLKLGTVLGTRTWGGLIGISGNPQLADGGVLLAATFRFLDTDGRWAVEDEGVSPDIEVIDRPELVAAGRDPGVEAAVAELMKQLPATPRGRIAAPPAPTSFGD